MNAPLVSEQQILQALRRIPPARWGEVLALLQGLQKTTNTPGVSPEVADLAGRVWTADELQQLPREQQDAVLREQAARLVAAYHADPAAAPERWWVAVELARLPPEQRSIVLAASAEVAAEEYHTNQELTAFDACGEDDLYVDSSPHRAAVRSGW